MSAKRKLEEDTQKEPRSKHPDTKQDATLSGTCENEQCRAEIPGFFTPGQKRIGILLLHVNATTDKTSATQVSQLFCSMKCVSEYSSRRTCQ